MGIQYPEFVENPENRCPVVLVLDTSASMEGAPIQALNAGLAAFKFDVEQDELAALRVEVAVVTFGGDVQVLQDFITVDQFTAPQLVPRGRSPMGHAVHKGLDLLNERKMIYQGAGIQYYRPWLFLVSDGAPTDEDMWESACIRVQQGEAQNKFNFYAIGVEDADMDVLAEISSPDRPPLYLRDLSFEDLFRWLSASVRSLSRGRVGGDMIPLPSVLTWKGQG